jgi:4-alpha-glucanotransferase
MNDSAIRDLARRAGFAVTWRDYVNNEHRVSIESLRRLLAALDLPCETPGDLAHSLHRCNPAGPPPLVTATIGKPFDLPVAGPSPRHVHITYEDGRAVDMPTSPRPRAARLGGIETPGYHAAEVDGRQVAIAVAPARCTTVDDIRPGQHIWGLVAQVYGLRSAGDFGIGDMAGVVALAEQAAALGADALALSPLHAVFAADPRHSSPYSPSSRLFFNPLHADPRLLFGDARVERAAADAGVTAVAAELHEQPLIDWPRSASAKLAMLRRLFTDFASAELSAPAESSLAADFGSFRAAGGALLENHARFEVLHAASLAANTNAWSWTEWPKGWRNPENTEVRAFAERHQTDVTFHCFLQWVAGRSIATAQQAALQAGMRVGLIADLAIGMSRAGSHAWSAQNDILMGVEIGAPPDLYNTNGQNWGLTTFSPRALVASGFRAFVQTLRASLRDTGGLRIDHAMGLLRLWVIPVGAQPADGAYLSYPLEDLMRLIALESSRLHSIIIGEDLGTVPAGFDRRLADVGVYGMGVLWFERERGRFKPPQRWPTAVAAMTSTHDLPTVAGWWSGNDIATRAQLGLAPEAGKERAERRSERKILWRAFRRAKAAEGDPPADSKGGPVADAAVKFVSQTGCDIVLLPLEDALALEEQPNLPGTVNEHPNWRRRYATESKDLLSSTKVRERLTPLARRDAQ